MERPACYDCRKEFDPVPGNPYIVDDTLGFEIWYLCPECAAKRKAAGRPMQSGKPPAGASVPPPASPAPAPPPAIPDPRKRGWFGGGRG